MNYGGDAAEQVVRMSLEGMDVALRVSGSAAKNLVAILAALSREDKTSMGRTYSVFYSAGGFEKLCKRSKKVRNFVLRCKEQSRTAGRWSC